MGKSVWHYLNKNPEDQPKEEGTYLVRLAYPTPIHKDGFPEWQGGVMDDNEWEEGEINYEIDTRWFGPVVSDTNWAMDDCPEDAKLWWTEEMGSSWHERVVAWANMDDIYVEE